MSEQKGVIYILTNPSFPQYVKIGYADDINKRLAQLNRSECTPFAFRVYATYEVNSRLSDLKIHDIIDKLNSNLRSIETFGGKKCVREFYAMEAEEAYSLVEAIAEIHGCTDKLIKFKPTHSEEEAEALAEDIESEHKERLSPFSFDKCNIPVGATFEFPCKGNPFDGKACTVVNEKEVEYEGKRYSLSSLATELCKSKWSVAGPRYFKYNGEWLNDIRRRLGV